MSAQTLSFRIFGTSCVVALPPAEEPVNARPHHAMTANDTESAPEAAADKESRNVGKSGVYRRVADASPRAAAK